MINPEYVPEVAEAVNGVLDEIGLRPHRDDLVVVGGAAMAVWGVVELPGRDLDIVINNDLRLELWKDKNWDKVDELSSRQLKYMPELAQIAGVTVLMPPMSYSSYRVKADEFIAEGVPCGQAGYLYSPLPRILETKRALAAVEGTSEPTIERQQKNQEHVRLITDFAIANNIEL
jgi:hypothetical protein